MAWSAVGATQTVRVIAAGLFVFLGLLVAVALLGNMGVLDRAPEWLVASSMALLMFALLATALWLFNAKGSDPFHRLTAEQHIQELLRLGLLESTTFRATRAFGVEEYEDEGLHYFIELVDRRVLFLSGQYLYDFEPMTDEGAKIGRSFPCSEFTVRRHLKERFVVDIECGGDVLEPDVMLPPFTDDDWRGHRVPEDGRLIADTTYDALKEDRLRRARAPRG
jgi:hypothetical protein